MEYNFDDIRPFNDSEYHSVVKELIKVKPLMQAIETYLPHLKEGQIEAVLKSYNTIQEFQSNMSCGIVQAIIDSSMDSFSYGGLSELNKDGAYLYLSNHRDIVLDSALINYCLDINEFDTCEIAIGSNLVSEPWVNKLVRLNKSFIVKRGLPKLDMLEASKTLSAYINHAINEKKSSIWIAQREGRAKDGDDKTNPALLKMFGLSKTNDLLEYLISLNITPVSISYELDPCDYLKIPELIKKSQGDRYEKAEGEDNEHMVLGMNGYKARTHVEFTYPINDKIKKLSGIKNRNELLQRIAQTIDEVIYNNYKLWSTNYIAYDMYTNTTKYVDKYTEEEKLIFTNYMNERLAKLSSNDLNQQFFLKMYANPVINWEGA